ncbi:uncharacterized protein LOC102497786 [Tupaia chinensis]|uniref:uncharacterized protein LOC102497786 n=1 Tax=Tupaia chinensis TaxID=246437 RepID=UPI000FFCC167|nr:uncharacterized protein LOC102497786 [Tupaia chinensis]
MARIPTAADLRCLSQPTQAPSSPGRTFSSEVWQCRWKRPDPSRALPWAGHCGAGCGSFTTCLDSANRQPLSCKSKARWSTGGPCG